MEYFTEKTTPLWPQTNGEIHRQNSPHLKIIKIAQFKKWNWQDTIAYISYMVYRSHHILSLELVYPKCYMEEQSEQNFLNYMNLKVPV